MIIPTIPDREFIRRLTDIQKQMALAKVDLLIAFGTECEPAYVRYLADYWPNFETAAVLIPASGAPTLLIGPESLTYASARSRIPSIVRMTDFRESSQPQYPGTTLPDWRAVLPKRVKTIGIAGWHMFPHAIMKNLTAAFAGSIVEADALLRTVMIRKSEAEIRCLRASSRISEIALAATLDVIKPGMTEIEVIGVATQAMMAAGAESAGYSIWCASGPNSNQAISRPTARKLRKGEVVHLQLGAKVSGYSTSIARPVVFGRCPKILAQFLEAGRVAEEMTIDLLRAGTKASEVATRVHGWLRQAGYGDAILYGPAHGCGQMECEWPFIETSCDLMLEEDMVFQVDVFMNGKKFGNRWEDCVRVREGKPAEQFSSLRREVILM